MLRRKLIESNGLAAILAGALYAIAPFETRAEPEYVTAGKVLKELEPNEFVWFVSGIVQGLAYSRFRQDTIAAGEKVLAGSDCIRNWFYGTQGRTLTIRSTFEQYAEHAPWVVVAAMVKQECGE